MEATVKTYRRRLNRGMAISLREMRGYAEAHGWRPGMSFPAVHVASATSHRHREEGKLCWWGLAEEASQPEGLIGRGRWLVLTAAGIAFSQGDIAVPEFAVSEIKTLHFNGEEYKTDEKVIELTGRRVSITDLTPFSAIEVAA